MCGSSKEHKTSFPAVAIPKLFFFFAGFLTTIVVVAGASTGVANVPEKFESFLKKKREEAYVQQNFLIVTA